MGRRGAGRFLPAFNVAVGRAGPGGFDAYGDEGFFLRGGVHGGLHQGAESFPVLNELVGRDDQHDAVRIRRLDESDAQGDGGSRVTADGFGYDVVRGDVRRLAAHFRLLQMVGQDEDVLPGNEAVQPVDGLAEQGVLTDDIQELLGAVVPGKRPEARAAAAGQNESILIHGYSLMNWVQEGIRCRRNGAFCVRSP